MLSVLYTHYLLSITIIYSYCNNNIRSDLVFIYLQSLVDLVHKAFGLPTLGLRFDGIPGRLNAVAFQFARAGFFRGTCMELCGMLHA